MNNNFCAEYPELANLLGISPDDTYESDIEKMAQDELRTRRAANARLQKDAAGWRYAANTGDFSRVAGVTTTDGAWDEVEAAEAQIKSEDINIIRAELMAQYPA